MLASVEIDHARNRRRRGSSLRPRALVASAVLSLAALLLLAPAAFGAGDPVRAGSFQLKLSAAFKNRLGHQGVAVTPKSFAINSGSIDPITGAGSLTLSGTLRVGARRPQRVRVAVRQPRRADQLPDRRHCRLGQPRPACVRGDPHAFVVTTNGTVIRLNSSAANFLNLLLPQPSPGDPSMQFADGDAFGTAGVTVQVR